MKALVDKGIFRFALPNELGGDNATICETIEVLEAIAAIDGSVAWNVMIGSEINAMVAGGMDPELAKEVYLDNPGLIMCGGGGPGRGGAAGGGGRGGVAGGGGRGAGGGEKAGGAGGGDGDGEE